MAPAHPLDDEQTTGPGRPPTRSERRRRLANRLNLSTPLGLLVARTGGARTRPGPYGLVLAEGYRLGLPAAGAFTVGDVVITTRSFGELLRVHPQLLVHEERHARQWARWLGLPFLPAYGLATAWSALRTGDRSSANVFERRAGLHDGGYVVRPSRTVPELFRSAQDHLRTARNRRG